MYGAVSGYVPHQDRFQLQCGRHQLSALLPGQRPNGEGIPDLGLSRLYRRFLQPEHHPRQHGLYLQGGGLRAGYKDRLALLRSGDDGGLRGRLPQQQGALPRLLHDLQRPLSVQLGQRHERQEPRRGEGSALFRAGEGVYRLQSGAGKRADLPAAAAGAGGRGR